MQAVELFEQETKPPEVARRLRASSKSAYQWHQLRRDGGEQALAPAGRADRDAGCPRAVWRNWPRIWSRGRPRMAGWRIRCGRPQRATLRSPVGGRADSDAARLPDPAVPPSAHPPRRQGHTPQHGRAGLHRAGRRCPPARQGADRAGVGPAQHPCLPRHT
ncbi:hypothetical protein AB0E81_10020 [Streptomyces sp. NPDC033538]|uniref:hypothetical protein n=1 Tax=Streptomyces sp. NPDC033538 TaxID=3155367 RepID=UPI0033E8922A